MENLHWQLSVLGRAVHYKNLSGAAAHVGLSQPQLSRIVSRLEKELNVVLLDRTVRRKSGWTPVAYRIADTYFRASRKMTAAIQQQLSTDQQLIELHIGTLEGLIPQAQEFCAQLFEQTAIHRVDLNVFDLSELEEHFEKDELDLVLTCREPGRQKTKYIRTLGYQLFEEIEDLKGDVKVMSSFEYSQAVGRRQPLKQSKVLTSNSLAVRRSWVETQGGSGRFPSDVRKKRTGAESEMPVVMIGSDVISPAIWAMIEEFRF